MVWILRDGRELRCFRKAPKNLPTPTRPTLYLHLSKTDSPAKAICVEIGIPFRTNCGTSMIREPRKFPGLLEFTFEYKGQVLRWSGVQPSLLDPRTGKWKRLCNFCFQTGNFRTGNCLRRAGCKERVCFRHVKRLHKKKLSR
jgi:hypothetical protein